MVLKMEFDEDFTPLCPSCGRRMKRHRRKHAVWVCDNPHCDVIEVRLIHHLYEKPTVRILREAIPLQ